MGARGPYVLVDTTPAKTILVYRNGDQFFVGRKFVLARRRVATFEALLDQLTEQVAVSFGVQRLYTPTGGHRVRELAELQPGGKYVAAARERFKPLDYINIVPRKPPKMRKLKEIQPVVHCDINVPSRWQTSHCLSRLINVFTNGRLFAPPVRVAIPRFQLAEWDNVLGTVGEKVFPLGGVRKLFTMSGRLLSSSKDLHSNHFYVAAGLEPFKSLPYWKCLQVPTAVQQKYMGATTCSRKKKKGGPRGKEPQKDDRSPPEAAESVFYAKEGKETPVAPFVQGGAEGDVYRAQTRSPAVQGALEVTEDHGLWARASEEPVSADAVKEDEEILDRVPDFAGSGDEDGSWTAFKKRTPVRHNAEEKEKEPRDFPEEENTPVLLETPGEIEDELDPPPRQQSQESSPRHLQGKPKEQESLTRPSLGPPSQEQIHSEEEAPAGSSRREPSRERLSQDELVEAQMP